MPMQPISPDELRLDKSVVEVSRLEDEDPDIEFWADATPEDRLRHMELLRRLNYGHRATARLQRVLTVAERT